MPDDWELAHGLNPNDPSDATTDPDGDGYPNLLEYALWLDPQSGSMAGLPQAGQSGGYLTLTYQTPTANNGITYEVQAAGDPAGPWSPRPQDFQGMTEARPWSMMGKKIAGGATLAAPPPALLCGNSETRRTRGGLRR